MNEDAFENLPRTTSIYGIRTAIIIIVIIALWPSARRRADVQCVLFPELRCSWVMINIDWPHGTSCWECINLTNVIDLKQWAQLKWWGYLEWARSILTWGIGTVKLAQRFGKRENNLVVSFRSQELLDGGKSWIQPQYTQPTASALRAP